MNVTLAIRHRRRLLQPSRGTNVMAITYGRIAGGSLIYTINKTTQRVSFETRTTTKHAIRTTSSGSPGHFQDPAGSSPTSHRVTVLPRGSIRLMGSSDSVATNRRSPGAGGNVGPSSECRV